MRSQASNHQNNSSYTLLPRGRICVSCVEKVNTHKQINPTLNEACRSITGCLIPTFVENVYSGVRMAIASRQERRQQTEDPMDSLYIHQPVNKLLKSRNSFVHSVTSPDKTLQQNG